MGINHRIYCTYAHADIYIYKIIEQLAFQVWSALDQEGLDDFDVQAGKLLVIAC